MAMHSFRKTAFGRSVMFAVGYDDGRTGYLVVQNHGTTDQDYLIPPLARERQAQGELPEGTICTIKRVR
ncbi:MAG TPA: hypothetical protein VHL98_22105 [Microvirga sp.]|nr:hypothetical protein [Microvirga sp.]